MRALVIATLLLSSGCSAQSDGITVSGQLLLDGIATEGEIVIEPLVQKDVPTPSSVTVFADSNGRFTATIAHQLESVDAIPCRVVVRVSTPTDADVPAALNEQAPPDRMVTLRRSLNQANEWSVLLTH